jgi:hypothetical protein
MLQTCHSERSEESNARVDSSSRFAGFRITKISILTLYWY